MRCFTISQVTTLKLNSTLLVHEFSHTNKTHKIKNTQNVFFAQCKSLKINELKQSGYFGRVFC